MEHLLQLLLTIFPCFPWIFQNIIYFRAISPRSILQISQLLLDIVQINLTIISVQFGVRCLLVYFQHCFPFSSSWFSVNSMHFLKSNTSFLTSSICCLVIEKFPLIRFEIFSCSAKSSLNTFLINTVKCFSSLVYQFLSAILPAIQSSESYSQPDTTYDMVLTLEQFFHYPDTPRSFVFLFTFA